MLKRLALIGAGAATMLALGTVPAYAAYQDVATVCSSGDSGKACIHLEYDAPSGLIHARGAVDPKCGHEIRIEQVRLDEQVTQAGETYPWGEVSLNTPNKSTSCGVLSYTAPTRAQCDNGSTQFRYAYRAVMHYRVYYAGGSSKGYSLATAGHDSPC